MCFDLGGLQPAAVPREPTLPLHLARVNPEVYPKSVAALTRRAKHLRFFRNECQVILQKYFSLRKTETRLCDVHPARHEGRFANVTIRGAGCDGRVLPQDERHDAYGQAAWS